VQTSTNVQISYKSTNRTHNKCKHTYTIEIENKYGEEELQGSFFGPDNIRHSHRLKHKPTPDYKDFETSEGDEVEMFFALFPIRDHSYRNKYVCFHVVFAKIHTNKWHVQKITCNVHKNVETVATCNHENPQNNTQTRACVSQGIRTVFIWEFEQCVSRNSNSVCLGEFEHLPWCWHHTSYFYNQTNIKIDESVIRSMLLVDLYSYNWYITTSMCVFMSC